MKYLLIIGSILFNLKINAQAVLTLSNSSHSITIDNIADFANDIEIYAITNLNVESSLGVNWDLSMIGGSFSSTEYTTQGTALAEENLLFKAFNFCSTPNMVVPPPANDINSTNYNHLGNNANFGTIPYYIVGSSNFPDNVSDAANADAVCRGTCNEDGTPLNNPKTHVFRIDAQIDLSAFRSALGGVIKPGFYTYNVIFQLNQDGNPGINASVGLTVEIEVLPILQLKLNSLDQIDFNFTTISEYISGITKNNKTIIEASSNMDWDLIPIGTSIAHQSSAANYFWDVNASYSSSSGSDQIPLTALQLFQAQANPSTDPLVDDYSTPFSSDPASTDNNITVASGYLSFALNADTESSLSKCIAGRVGQVSPPGSNMTNSVRPGSYFVVGNWTQSQYRYSISYKLKPGLPAIFENAKPTMSPNFAKPGYYTMQVRYVLTEDQ